MLQMKAKLLCLEVEDSNAKASDKGKPQGPRKVALSRLRELRLGRTQEEMAEIVVIPLILDADAQTRCFPALRVFGERRAVLSRGM